MDIDRLIALTLFTREVIEWEAIQNILKVYALTGKEVPPDLQSEVDAYDGYIEELLLAAPDWVVGRA